MLSGCKTKTALKPNPWASWTDLSLRLLSAHELDLKLFLKIRSFLSAVSIRTGSLFLVEMGRKLKLQHNNLTTPFTIIVFCHRSALRPTDTTFVSKKEEKVNLSNNSSG